MEEEERTVTPVVDKGQHELHAVFLCRVDRVVQPLEAVRAVVDVTAGRVEDLEVDLVGVHVGGQRRRVDVAEAPDTEDLVRGLQVCGKPAIPVTHVY